MRYADVRAVELIAAANDRAKGPGYFVSAVVVQTAVENAVLVVHIHQLLWLVVNKHPEAVSRV